MKKLRYVVVDGPFILQDPSRPLSGWTTFVEDAHRFRSRERARLVGRKVNGVVVACRPGWERRLGNLR